MKNKIPTILGIVILLTGIAAGILLIENSQLFRLGAEQDFMPRNVRISNIDNDSFTVSWTTNKETRGFLVWGKERTSLNNTTSGKDSLLKHTHSIEVDNLTSNTTYFFKIGSGEKLFGSNDMPWPVKTGKKLNDSRVSNIISGTIKTRAGSPLGNALVFVTVKGSALLSTQSNKNGEWTINISSARSQSLDQYIEINDQESLVEIFVQGGPQGTASAKTYPVSAKPLPPIIIGQTHNFRKLETSGNNIPEASVRLPKQ